MTQDVLHTPGYSTNSEDFGFYRLSSKQKKTLAVVGTLAAFCTLCAFEPEIALGIGLIGASGMAIYKIGKHIAEHPLGSGSGSSGGIPRRSNCSFFSKSFYYNAGIAFAAFVPLYMMDPTLGFCGAGAIFLALWLARRLKLTKPDGKTKIVQTNSSKVPAKQRLQGTPENLQPALK